MVSHDTVPEPVWTDPIPKILASSPPATSQYTLLKDLTIYTDQELPILLDLVLMRPSTTLSTRHSPVLTTSEAGNAPVLLARFSPEYAFGELS